MMAAALNATGRPIAFSCSWPAYEGGLPPKVSHSVCPPGSPNCLLTSCAVRAAPSPSPLTIAVRVLICRSREKTLSTPEAPSQSRVLEKKRLLGG